MSDRRAGPLVVDPTQVDTLVAVVDEGSFDAAAHRLGISPSAVSQRIKGLETAVGAVLVRRASSCTATRPGEPLLRYGRQLRLLRQEAWTELGGRDVMSLPLAVEPDSLRTWFTEVLRHAAASWPSTALTLAVTGAAGAADLLRRGEVAAAVSKRSDPVQGCDVEPLGIMRYVAVVAPALLNQHRASPQDWHRLPRITTTDAELPVQHQSTQNPVAPAIVHQLPAGHDHHNAVRLGLGWGRLPESAVVVDEKAGGLVRLPMEPVDVPLYWHRWRLETATSARLHISVVRAATAGLHQQVQTPHV